ncbi:MAG: nuclear transport factor 2 family protein [Devosia sp.]|nr:nuclear transport factor 2 family protein [Devosia sp.]
MSGATLDAATRRAIGWDVSQRVLGFFLDFDNSRYDRMAQAFTPDGVWDRSGLQLRGREAIVAEMSRRPASAEVRHVITNLIVTAQDAGHAQVSFYNTSFRYDDGTRPVKAPRIKTPFLVVLGEGRLVLSGEDWLFEHQSAKRLFEFES